MESQTAGEAFPAGRPTKRELEILGLLAEGLTNRQIADRLALAVSTIKWYNRQLYSRLAVENRRDAVIRARELGLLTGYGAPVRPRHNLPVQATPFVGREQELDLLVRWLSDPALRLVTITGPGGMGKTRLAMEVALRLTGKFTDGVAFVSLAPLQSADGIVPALAGALRFKPSGGTGEAREQLEEAADGMRQIDARDYLCWVLTALSCALTRKGDLSRARETLLEAVTIGLELPTTLPFVASGVALLALAEGETERAVELYALACEHPSVANSRWFEDVVGRQLDESAARLPPEAAVTARERGRRLELQEAAEALARELAASLHDDG